MSVFCKRAGVSAACLLFGVLLVATACDQFMGDPSSTDAAPSAGQTVIGDYILVRGDNSGNDVLRQVLNLKHAIDEQFETDTLSSTDWAVDAGEGTEGQREILVGVTNREESVAANEELEGVHGYVIRSTGDKIVITASTTGLLEEAVTRFTEKYVKGANGGMIPDQINISHKADLPLCVMNDPSAMRLFVSEEAEATLEAAVNDFADRIADLSGVRPEIVEDAQLEEEKVVVLMKNTVFSDEETGNPAGLPEAVGPESWSMVKEQDKITLQGQSALQTIAALAGLYEQLSLGADRTLDGQSVFFYEKEGAYKESWGCAAPRLVGARYLGTESIAGNSRCSYYESVSLNAYGAWKLLIADELFGSFVLQDSTAASSAFLSVDGNTEVVTYYSSDERTLTVVEKTVRG